jgi:prevent-host-death family protein
MKMLKKISAVKARKNFGQMMDQVALRGDDYIIERSGRPMAVMIPMDRYNQILQAQKKAKESLEKFWEKMDTADEEEIAQVVGEAISSVRSGKFNPKKQ